MSDERRSGPCYDGTELVGPVCSAWDCENHPKHDDPSGISVEVECAKLVAYWSVGLAGCALKKHRCVKYQREETTEE